MAQVTWAQVRSACQVSRFGWLTIPSEEFAILAAIPERSVLALQNAQIRERIPSKRLCALKRKPPPSRAGLLQNYTV